MFALYIFNQQLQYSTVPGDSNLNVNKAICRISKTTTLRAHHTVLYISLPSLHDFDVTKSYFFF